MRNQGPQSANISDIRNMANVKKSFEIALCILQFSKVYGLYPSEHQPSTIKHNGAPTIKFFIT